MRRPPIARHHLDSRTLLDYLDGRLEARAQRDIEEHLGGPCVVCRGRLREIGWLVQTMREDRSAPPPERVRARALEALSVKPPLPTAASQAWSLAVLLFDSLVSPAPAATRRATGDARWMKFALGEFTLELEAEVESAETWTLRGRLDLPEPALHHVEVEAREERLSTWPDAGGRFALGNVPAGSWTIRVRGPEQRFQLPTLSL